MGISHRNGGRTRHFDWGRHEDNSRMVGKNEAARRRTLRVR
jgi:hypothetical protein